MIETLYQYNDWANARVLKLAEDLTDEQLDSPRELGLGSLRATMFHIWSAEQVWLDRWQGVTNPVYHTQADGVPLAEIAARLQQTASQRQAFFDSNNSSGWGRQIVYRNFKQEQFTNALIDLAMHVANHGIHHRAQALHFLKQHNRKVTGGIDYLFFRIAYPTTSLIADYVEPMRQYGLEADSGVGSQVVFRQKLIQDFYSYHDWAVQQLMVLTEQLTPTALHEDRNMGVGSIHQSLAHLRDAESWWMGIWHGSESKFPKYDPTESLQNIKTSWLEIADRRNAVVESLDPISAARVVVANPGNLKIPFRVIESMVQLCCHGTHHRAQIVNMLRQSGITTSGIDYVVWLRRN